MGLVTVPPVEKKDQQEPHDHPFVAALCARLVLIWRSIATGIRRVAILWVEARITIHAKKNPELTRERHPAVKIVGINSQHDSGGNLS